MLLEGFPQLNQPQKGVHPPGVDPSALAHLLDGRATIDPSKGLFLKETWRLAFISEMFYDGRLAARPENQKQRVPQIFRSAFDGALRPGMVLPKALELAQTFLDGWLKSREVREEIHTAEITFILCEILYASRIVPL